MDEKYFEYIAKNKGTHFYVDEMNVEDLVAANYDGEKLQELTDEESKNFYSQRLSNIREMLEDGSRMNYTKKEVRHFLDKAEQLETPIPMGYAEGWKTLN